MKFQKLSLSFALFVAFSLLQVIPVWGGAIPKKSPSQYGDVDGQVQLTTPSFTPVSQDGVNMSLASVFCSVDGCGGDQTTAALSYFFAITLDPTAQLDALEFSSGFNDFGVTIFDGSFTCATGFTCVPGSSEGLNFDNVNLVTDCSSGDCVLTFENFNANTIGAGGTIYLAGGTLDGSKLNVNGVPQSVQLLSITTSRTTATVPEPSALWFAGIACLICFLSMWKKQKQSAFVS